jgi:hypothetical protein
MREKLDENKNFFCLPSENLVQILPESGSALDPDPYPHIINAEQKNCHRVTPDYSRSDPRFPNSLLKGDRTNNCVPVPECKQKNL